MLNDGLYIKLSINKYIKVVEGEKKLDLPTFNEREREIERLIVGLGVGRSG